MRIDRGYHLSFPRVSDLRVLTEANSDLSYPVASAVNSSGEVKGNDDAAQAAASNKVAVIAGTVAGVVAALLLVFATFLLTRHYLQRHRQAPDPGFEVDDEESCTDQLQPFVLAMTASTSGTSASGAILALAPNDALAGASNAPPLSSSGLPSSKTTSPAMSPLAQVSDNSGSSKPSRVETSGHPVELLTASSDQHGTRGRVVHEEDADDNSPFEVLPPMYREAWGSRRTSDLLDGSVGVVRMDEARAPGRAQDVGHIPSARTLPKS